MPNKCTEAYDIDYLVGSLDSSGAVVYADGMQQSQTLKLLQRCQQTASPRLPQYLGMYEDHHCTCV